MDFVFFSFFYIRGYDYSYPTGRNVEIYVPYTESERTTGLKITEKEINCFEDTRQFVRQWFFGRVRVLKMVAVHFDAGTCVFSQ